MKKGKRFLVLILTVIFWVGCLPATSLAEETSSEKSSTEETNGGNAWLSFDKNGGYGTTPSTITGNAGDLVTLPESAGTRNGYTFLGWANSRDLFPGGTDYRAVYPAGSTYELQEGSKTLYGAWSKKEHADTYGIFYIRKDGQIPYEPGSYLASEYSPGIRIANAVTTQKWVIDVDTTKPMEGNHVANEVTARLNRLPSDDQIRSVYPEYNSATDYIHWYVQKYNAVNRRYNASGYETQTGGTYIQDGWHIDGVLLKKAKVAISYDANVPAGVTSIPDVPQGYQVTKGTTVTVGESGGVGGSTSRQNPSIEGYTFLGWNTRADGSGTMYSNGTSFALNENLTLYAIWSKGKNMLTLQKTDGFGGLLEGASFTLSDGSNTSSFTAGNYTNRNILTNTVYTVTETKAPSGYQKLAAPFHFIVTSDGDSRSGYLCDADGNELQAGSESYPSGVTFSYEGGIIKLLVKNTGCFYVYHTADTEKGTWVQEIPMIPDGEHWNADHTYNLTADTTSGFLYGGYYRDYAKKGSYDPDHPQAGSGFAGSETYTGDETSWDGTEAYVEKGTAITPTAGTTYFLKEVPSTYLRPALYVVYDTVDRNQIKKLYLLTAVDDGNYSFVGWNTAGSSGITGEQGISGALSHTVEVKKMGSMYDTLSSTKIFNIPGLLALSEEKNEYLVANGIFTEIPTFVTLDGVTVTGSQKLRVYLRDTTYQNWKKPGITKAGQKTVIHAE